MKRVIITAILLIINFILQSTVFNYIEIRGVIPNTAIIFIVSFALLRGSLCGAAAGFFSGLLYDIFFGASIGYYALINMVIGWLCGKFNTNFYRENYLLPALLSIAGVIASETVIYITHIFMSGSFMYAYFIFNKILPEAVYTLVLVIPVYRISFAVNEWLESKERRSRRLF